MKLHNDGLELEVFDSETMNGLYKEDIDYLRWYYTQELTPLYYYESENKGIYIVVSSDEANRALCVFSKDGEAFLHKDGGENEEFNNSRVNRPISELERKRKEHKLSYWDLCLRYRSCYDNEDEYINDHDIEMHEKGLRYRKLKPCTVRKLEELAIQ